MRKKMFANEFRVYPSDYELAKVWFVQGWVEVDGNLKRMKWRVPMAKTVEQRLILANNIIKTLQKEGYSVRQKREKEFDAANFILANLNDLLIEKKASLRKKSYQSYRSHLRNFNDYCSEKKVCKVDEDVAREFLNFLKVKGRSNTTINAHRLTLKHFFSELVNRNRLKNNPFGLTKKLKENREGAHYMKLTEIAKYKKYVLEHKPFLWLPSIMQFYTFLRPSSELRFIKVADVDLDRKLIRVDSNISKNGQFDYVKIPLPLQTVLIDMNLEDYASNFFLIGLDGLPSEKPVSYNYWGSHFRQVRAAMRLSPKYKLYSFKHSGVVDFMRNGGNVMSLQRQLRHHSLDMTQIYLRSIGIEDMDNLESHFSEI
jgi:site-specific recombinase XerD